MKIKYICSPQLTAICNVKLTFLLLMKSSRLQMNWYIYVQWMYTCACERSSNLSITNTILSLASVPFFTSFSPFHPHKWANVARYTGTIIVSMFICMPLNMYFKLILDKNSYPFHFWISCTENSTIQYDSHGERRYCPVHRIKIQRRKIRDKCREKARQREKNRLFLATIHYATITLQARYNSQVNCASRRSSIPFFGNIKIIKFKYFHV